MLIVCSMAGYGFAKYKSPGKERVYKIFNGVHDDPVFLDHDSAVPNDVINESDQFPGSAGDTQHSVGVSDVFLPSDFSGFPYETLEAARIDGANDIGYFSI